MDLRYKEKEFALSYATGNYMALRKALGADNLRKTLLEAYNREDYSALAKGLFQFSDKELPNADAAYSCMDNYLAANGGTLGDMFLAFLEELGEAGFFREKKSAEELRELAESPELALDMGTLMADAVKLFKGDAMKELVRQAVGEGITTTGANTSRMSGTPPSSAE